MRLTRHNGGVTAPEPAPTRRDARATRSDARARRERERRRRRQRAFVGAGVVVLSLGVAAVTVSALADPQVSEPREAVAAAVSVPTLSLPLASDIPAPEQTSVPAPTGLCDVAAVRTALDAGEDEAAIVAAGGGEAFRAAVADGRAECIQLNDASRRWLVVNKQQPLSPVDYVPSPLARAEGVDRTSGGHMRADTAEALAQLAAAASDAGVGGIGVNSGYRPYSMQVRTYEAYVREHGRAAAERSSARPGHSEHQTGLSVDVIACGSRCGGIHGFGGTSQSDWVAENAWRHGFIIRYDEGHTETTGYKYEPWHLRFVGKELAAAYRDGGYDTLEEFFGLEGAPTYAE